MTSQTSARSDAHAPYLSVVVATRNDQHGGDPLKRLQALLTTFAEQCRRASLSAEVIVVEWNPPADRPRVAELCRVPADAPFEVRFIEVPAELHRTLRFASVLPLFQMIAKNVGIRRARGRFVLATNIDVLLSTELVEDIAARQLNRMCIYRADRHDIEADVPMGAPLAERMQYCASHHLRIHRRQGSYMVAPNGGVRCSAEDIVDGEAVRLGSGWHVPESAGGGRCFRWAHAASELIVDPEAAGFSVPAVLQIDVESNPHQQGSWIGLMAVQNRRLLARARIDGDCRFQIPLDGSRAGERRITLLVFDGHQSGSHGLPMFERRGGLAYRAFSARLWPAPVSSCRETAEYPLEGWTNANAGSRLSLNYTPEGLEVVSDPRAASYCIRYGPLRAPASGAYRFEIAATVLEGDVIAGVLSAGGRFWVPSHVGDDRHSTGRWITIDVELYAGHPYWLVVYNNHPDGNAASRFVIHRLDGPASVRCEQSPPSRIARRLLSSPVAERAAVVYAKVVPAARRVRARTAEAFGQPRPVRSALTHLLVQCLTRSLGSAFQTELARTSPPVQRLPSEPGTAQARRALDPLDDLRGFLMDVRPEDLHVNGCGDFQLMAREKWEILRGYPEFETFSMNIDALLSYMANAAGLKEQVFGFPIYHLEHEVGSGWSPEGETLLRQRIAERGIPWVDARTVHIWAAYMRWLARPMIFNGPDWGLQTLPLPETMFRPRH